MNDRSGLILYSTSGCSLCERALDLLLSMPELAGVGLRVVDVAHTPDLMLRYGSRLPVLAFGSAELDGPFAGNEIRTWLRAAGGRS